jgi:NADH:ubiquinone oxidoreductase subunit 6 (subunit J)
MVPWLVAGAVTLLVLVGAAFIVFRVVMMTADAETDDDDIDEMDGADSEWRPPASTR